ncbi:hypothetical protein OC846_001679 [Tilletia horrida]|uniref:GPN-loop GTPase 3 n=1 Tax=Tilletia horrida TaxID=155126 RepID=A0AAN6JSU1_9BASI|nr:hypothetical protein OC846_001679 [Tilletia horrida]
MFTVKRFNDESGGSANAGSTPSGENSKLAALNARIAARRAQNQQQLQSQSPAPTPSQNTASAPISTTNNAPAIHPSRLRIAPALRAKDPDKPKTKAKQRYLKAKKERRKSRIKARPKGEKAKAAAAAATVAQAESSAEERNAIALAWKQRASATKETSQQDSDSSSSSSDSDGDSDSESESDEDDDGNDAEMGDLPTTIQADSLQPHQASQEPNQDDDETVALQRFPAPRSTLLPATSAILRAQGLPTGLSTPTIINPFLRASLVDNHTDSMDEERSGRESKRRKVAHEQTAKDTSDVITPLISQGMKERLQELGIKEWFAVQTSVIPLLLPNPRPSNSFYPIARPSQIPRDLLVAAPTGSGKTLAYIVPLLEWLGRRPVQESSKEDDPILAAFTAQSGPVLRKLRALIVLPTKDLVNQVAETVQLLSKGLDIKVGLAGVTGGSGGSLFSGGAAGGLLNVADSGSGGSGASATFALEQERLVDLPPLKERQRGIFAQDSSTWWPYLLDPESASSSSSVPQAPQYSFQSKVDILITTPGRLVDHVSYTPGFTLEHLRWLILDEADRLLAQSFGGWREKVWEALRPKAATDGKSSGSPTGSNLRCGPAARAPAWQRAERLEKDGSGPFPLWQDEDPELASQSQVQKILFSATLTRDPGMLEALELRRPLFVTVREKAGEAAMEGEEDEVVQDGGAAFDDESFALPDTLKEHVLITNDIPKPLALLHLLLSARFDMLSNTNGTPSGKKQRTKPKTLVQDDPADVEGGGSGSGVLVFTKSVEAARRLVRLLELFKEEHGAREVKALAVKHYSSEMRISERRKVLKSFADGEVNVLVASDLIARGIDLPSVGHVISYDVPVDRGKYVHRVGRTARAGRSGHAWALVEAQEARHFRKVVLGKGGDGAGASATKARKQAVEKVKVDRSEWEGLEGAYKVALQRLATEFSPAGSGKSTFSNALITHAQSTGRTVHLFNLDPAAEDFEYAPSIDIRDLITLEDVMEEMQLGPNGGLIYCFEYLLQNQDWLQEQLSEYEDDYLIIDCPGQIELFTHTPLISQLVRVLTSEFNYRLCATYLVESQFMDDKTKYFSGVLSAMSAMINLELPHINLLSKMDLVEKGLTGGEARAQTARNRARIAANDQDAIAEEEERKRLRRTQIERYLDPDPLLLVNEINSITNPKFHSLNQAIVELIDDFSMVNFTPLDVTDEDSVGLVLSLIDNAIQYGEDEEPKEPKDMDREVDVDEAMND